MKFTDTQLRIWDKRRLRVGSDKRKVLMDQAGNLITKLEKAIPEESPFDVIRFRRAGSLVKATALQPRSDTGIDADIAVYLDDTAASDWDLLTLHDTLREVAIGVYPTKSPEDFWTQPHTMGMEFRASGLKVDLVPLIAIAGDDKRGWMVNSSGQKVRIADIPAHIDFVRNIARTNDRYRPLVRMIKRWRNEAELQSELGSFPIELILAQVIADQDPIPSLEEGLQRFFLYVAQSELQQPILSGHASAPNSSYPVVVLDPCDADNNVTSLMTEADRSAVVEAAKDAWEILALAENVGGKGESEGYWREVFGSGFIVEEES